jgi:anti-sigma factor RsiW
MRCEALAEALPGFLDGTDDAPRRAVRHVSTCLRCQAELAQYRRLLRALNQLRIQLPEPPPGTLGAVLAYVEAAASRQAVRAALLRRRVTYAGALTLAGVAGTAGAVVIATRARSTTRSLS